MTLLSLPIVLLIVLIMVVIMLVCLFHLTEYLIYRKIWGRNKKVLPLEKIESV
jgi:hypothetical protein